jgi:membrane-associated phospholipid phosphatase
MRRSRTTDGVAYAAAAVGLGCVALLAAVYLLAVWTRTGQHFEDGVLTGAEGVGRRQAYVAQLMLSTVRTASTIAAAAVIVGIGLVRRRAYAGIVGAGIVVAAAVTTQILQAVVERPILLRSGYRREDQSFPSGHTAIAMAVFAGLIFVVPYRFRWVAAPIAIGMGVATVTVGWHRPSDAVGSDLIVLAYACLAVVLLAKRGQAHPPSGRIRFNARISSQDPCIKPDPAGRARAGRARAGRARAGTQGWVVAVGAGLVLLILGSNGWPFMVGRTIVYTAGVLAALVFLALVHGMEFGPPGAEPGAQGGPAPVPLERDLEDGREEPSRQN